MLSIDLNCSLFLETTRTTLASIITKPEPTKETKKPEVKHETPSKTNGVRAGEVLMEEMLLEEEKEQVAVKPIDLDSLMIPESSTKKPEKQDEALVKVIPVSTSTITTTTTAPIVASIPSLTPSPTKKPYTLYKVPNTNHTTPPLALRHRKLTKTDSSNTRTLIEFFCKRLLNFPLLLLFRIRFTFSSQVKCR